MNPESQSTPTKTWKISGVSLKNILVTQAAPCIDDTRFLQGIQII